MKTKLLFLVAFLTYSGLIGQNEVTRTIQINKKYLNFPIQLSEDRQRMDWYIQKDKAQYIDIRLSDGQADYWVFQDVSAFKAKKINIAYRTTVAGLDKIYQSKKK